MNIPSNRRLQFDTVVVGTSPLALLEAYFRAKSGQAVAIIEEAAYPGGAWYTREVWGLKNVEMGCHILEKYNGSAYRFLKDTAGIPMVKVVPQPSALFKNAMISQELNAFLYDLKCFSGALVRFKVETILPLFRRLARTSWGAISRSNYLYPKNGCGEMIDRLVQLNRDSGSTFFFNSKTNSVHIHEGSTPSYCETTAGQIEFKRLIVTSNLKVDALYLKSVKVQIAKRERKTLHAILDLKGSQSTPFSYVNIMDKESLLIRVSDVGNRNLIKDHLQEEGRLILCVQLRADTETRVQRDSIPLKVLEELTRLKLIRAGATIVHSHLEYFESANIDPTAMELDPHAAAITILETSDLAAGISFYSKHWQKMNSGHGS